MNGGIDMYNILSLIFKYVFIIIIYFFIYSIIKLIYLDIRGLSFMTSEDTSYIRLLNDIESLPFLIKEYYVLNRELDIGRSINNDIIIQNQYISKNHTRLEKDGNKHYISDLNSSNGTYLNDKKILGTVELKNRDIIKIGNIEFEFKTR